MSDHDLPFEPDPSPEERQLFEQLSTRLDAWSWDAAERVPLPVDETRGARLRAADAGLATGSRTPRTAGTSRGLRQGWYVAAGTLAASIVGLMILGGPDPGDIESEPEVTGVSGTALQARDLEVASPHPYMIVPTRDPSISIVWILDTQPTEGD